MKPGMVFGPAKLDKDVERLEDYYGKDGYLYTTVRLIRQPNVDTGNIDVEYRIEEADRYNVESIVIEGNTKTKSTVILRELVLTPGDVFDTVRMKISKLRLENTRFFDDVNVTHQNTNLPGRENVRVAVKEGRTGALTFGAGYSSLQRATVFAEISQSNFDIFNARSLFQGDGQKFRIRLELGELSSEAILSFEEPWLFQKQLALRIQLFFRSEKLGLLQHVLPGGRPRRHGLSAQASVRADRRPALLHLRDHRNQRCHRPGLAHHRLRGRPSYRIQGSALPGAGCPRQDHQYDRGQLHGVRQHAGGPGPLSGAAANYYKLEFRGSQYFQLFEQQQPGAGAAGIARAGRCRTSATPPDGALYDTFYLGGPDDLRGYQYRFRWKPPRHLRRAGGRQDLRPVHRRVFHGHRRPRPDRVFL